MPGQFNGKYLDDLDPNELTDEQKQALTDLLKNDPYAFYNLFKDPDAAQRNIEGSGFKTTPAGELYKQIGALRAAGAPDHVIEYWQNVLETRNRESAKTSIVSLPAKTKPIPEKLSQIDAFCTNIDSVLNYVEDNIVSKDAEVDENFPWDAKWVKLMNIAKGDPAVTVYNKGTVKHYPSTDEAEANAGVEIVEITLVGPEVNIDLDAYKVDPVDGFDTFLPDHIQPSGMKVIRTDEATIIQLAFYNCYE